MLNQDIYYVTFAWDGASEETEGEYTTRRYSMEDLLDCVDEYIDYWKDRDAYVDCVSWESQDGRTDLTKAVQDYLTTKEKFNGI